MRIRLGSNTTIVGLGRNATIRGAWLDIRGTAGVANSRTNIIVRNITFQDTFDCFPQWAPTDGALGSWNSQYDSISLRDTNNVWIDHNTFEDRDDRGRDAAAATSACCSRCTTGWSTSPTRPISSRCRGTASAITTR